MLKIMGVKTIYAYNKEGIVSSHKNLEPAIKKLVDNKIVDSFDGYQKDSLKEIIKNSDVFIGVSVGNIVDSEMVNNMNDLPIVFALANPVPEISYEEIKKSKAYIYATGRSDFPNQINNVLAFPGIFKGLLSSKTKKITNKMCVNAAYAIASIVTDDRLSPDYIIPSVFDERVVEAVSKSIAKSEGENAIQN